MTDDARAGDWEVEALWYEAAGPDLCHQIAQLEERAYSSSDSAQATTDTAQPQPLHDPTLHARSFFIRSGSRVISYAAVVSKTIQHDEQSFSMSGLACVATEPQFQRQGLGRLVVAAATQHIAQSGVDLGVFTCAPLLAPLYAAAGAWPIARDVVLLGSRATGALTSTSLGVVVLL